MNQKDIDPVLEAVMTFMEQTDHRIAKGLPVDLTIMPNLVSDLNALLEQLSPAYTELSIDILQNVIDWLESLEKQLTSDQKTDPEKI